MSTDETAAWIDAFVLHVVKQVPRAPRDRLMAEAAVLCLRFGEYDPADVAEVEWSVLPLATPRIE